MSMFIPASVASNHMVPLEGLRCRLRSSCSVAVLGLVSVAAFASPAAAACPDPVGGTITTVDLTSCTNVDYTSYLATFGDGLNLLVPAGTKIQATGGTPVAASFVPTPPGTLAVGTITIFGTLQARSFSGAIINLPGSRVSSVGDIIFQTGSQIIAGTGGAASIDLTRVASTGAFTNYGTISASTNNAPVLNISAGVMSGSLTNFGSVSGNSNFLSSTNNETINGNVDNASSGMIIINDGRAFNFANTIVNGSLLNSGTIRSLASSAADSMAYQLNPGTNVTGSLTNSGSITGFNSGISATGTTIAGGIYNSGTIDGNIFGINYTGANTIGTITNAAGATIRGGTNSLNLAFGAASTVENSGTLDGAVNLGSVHTLNINGNAVRVIGDTTGTGTSRVNVNGNFTSEGNFTVPTFAVTNGTTTLLHTVTANTTSVAAPGTLQIGNNTASGHVGGDIANDGVVAFNRSDAYTYGYVISGAGRVEQKGPGTLILTGDQTYTGGTTVSGGILQLGDGGTTGSVAGNILNNSAVAFNRSDDYTFGNVISGTGAVTQNGPGKLILTGENLYTGGTTVATGSTLQIGAGATGSLVGNIANGGAVDFNRSNDYEYGGVISGAGTMTQNGPGRLILTGNNTYAGLTTIAAGTLQIGNGGTTGSVASDIFNNSALVFNRADTLTYGKVISGTGSVEQQGPGKLILSADQIYTGGTTVSGGTLQLGNNTASGSVVGNILNNGAVAFNRSDNYIFGAVVSGTGSVTQNGPGTLILTADQTYTGGTTVSGGTLQLGNNTASGSVVGNILNNAAVAFNRSDAYTYAGVISGTGSVTQNGPGTLILTADQTYTGGTTVSAGTLQLGNGGPTGSVVGDILNNAAVAFNRSDAYTYGGVISGSGTMTQNGPGALILTGNNTYAGLTTVAAGTLQIGNGGTTGIVASDILNNSALVFNRADTLAYDRVISGTGSVEQKGSGTLILSAAQTYGGGTRVSGGTLKLTGSIVSPAIVDSGATFANEGLVASTIANNGTLNLNGTRARVTGAVTGTGVVNVNGTFTSENTFAAGAFNVNGGAVFNMNHSIAAPVTVASGGLMNVMSSQAVDGNILNNGTIDVGANVLTTTGSYTQTAGATFMTAINYIGAGGYGQMKSAQALNVADGAVILATFASSEKYPAGTVVQDVLKGTGTPVNAGKITLFAQNQPNDEHYYWSAVWDGVNVDLVLKIYEGALPEPTLKTLRLDKGPILRLMHERFAMLNAVMEYDCAQFDKHGFCLSVQARATGFGLQSTGAGAFNMAYRFADKFRIGGFVDYQATYNAASVSGFTPESVHAYDNRPTFGGYAGFSETGYTSAPLQKGMQLFVSGGVNFGRISVTRAMFNDSYGFIDAQPGSGTARLDAYYVRGVAGYGLDVGEGLRVMPYVGLRYTDVTRGGYVEGVNALVTQPLAYEAFYERLITGFGGAQVAAMLTPAFGARAGLGAEVDFSRSANNYSGVSQIPGLPAFSLAHGGAWNGARPAANGGLFYNIAPNQRVFLNGATGQQAYTSRGYASGMLGYQAAF